MSKKLVDAIEVARATTAETTKETASLHDHERCPQCGEPLMKVTSLGFPAGWCEKHRIVLPELT